MVENVLKDVNNTYTDENLKEMIKEVIENGNLNGMVKKEGKERKNVVRYVDNLLGGDYFLDETKNRLFTWYPQRGRQMVSNFRNDECVTEDMYTIILNISDYKADEFAFRFGKIVRDINKIASGQETLGLSGVDYSDINVNNLDEELGYYYSDYNKGDRTDNICISVKGKDLETYVKIIEKVNDSIEAENSCSSRRKSKIIHPLSKIVPKYKDSDIGIVAESNNSVYDWLYDRESTIRRAITKTICENKELKEQFEKKQEQYKDSLLFGDENIDTIYRFITKNPTKEEFEEYYEWYGSEKSDKILLQDEDKKNLEHYIDVTNGIMNYIFLNDDNDKLKQEFSEKYLDKILENYKEVNQINGFSKDGLFKKEVQEKIERIKTEDDIEI